MAIEIRRMWRGRGGQDLQDGRIRGLTLHPQRGIMIHITIGGEHRLSLIRGQM